MSSGRPPTLWWLLMFAAVCEPDSITSGYSVPCTRNLAPVCSRATSSNTRMNSSPIALRLPSGSVTPASFARNRSCAFTCTSGTWKCRANVSSTCSGSPSRFSPWSTNTHVSWSPIARYTRSAATEESTPPESAHRTCASPTCARISRDLLVDDVRRGPIGQQPAPVEQEALHHGLSVRRVRDLRMELDREQTALRILHRGDRDRVGGRRHAEPFGRARHGVAVRHPHRVLAREVLQQDARALDVQLGRRRTRAGPSPRPRRRAPAPSAGGRSRSRAPAPRARTDRDRPAAPFGSYTLAGPPDRMMPAGRFAASSAALRSCGTISE